MKEALDDFKQVLVLDPSDRSAQQACRRLPPLAEEQREKLKTEVMSDPHLSHSISPILDFSSPS